jgi:poly(A) polymerase
MNALYATPDGRVVDPLGGLPDLLAGRVRFVGDPAARIAEDHLRILRFFRFHAFSADPAAGIDAEGLAACAAGAAQVARLSRERVGAEMRRLLAAPDPAPAVAAMQAAGVLAQVLPGADARQLACLVAIEAGWPPHWLRRLAVLGGEGAAARLRMTRAEAATWQALHGAVAAPQSPAELGYRLGAALAADAVLARAALSGTAPPDGWDRAVAAGAAQRFPLAARDLMPALAGEALGLRLRALEQAWVASGFALDRDALLRLP